MAIFGIPAGGELWLILAIVLILFGPSRLPKLAKSLGKSVKAVREGIDGKLDEGDESAADGSKKKSKVADVDEDDEE